MRWMVLASICVASDIRLAARPVGAAKAMFIPIESKTRISALMIVVLPVPGPPVSTITPFLSIAAIALFCIGA